MKYRLSRASLSYGLQIVRLWSLRASDSVSHVKLYGSGIVEVCRFPLTVTTLAYFDAPCIVAAWVRHPHIKLRAF